MSKYVVIGGFLGAGKTTSMLAFAEYARSIGKQPAILVNDLGARNLVDSSVTAAADCCASEEITGGCICYQTENLVDKLRRFRDGTRADIIFSDIPGCGIGALDHVYRKLADEYPGEVALCPFTAVADPERLRAIMPEHAELHLPREMDFLFDAQLKEAEVILLNKTDLLTAEETERYLQFLTDQYPHAKIFPMSAREKTGAAEVVDYLLTHESALPQPDIGYGGEQFIAAEKTLSWFNRQAFVKSAATFDGNRFLTALAESVRGCLTAAGRNVPHLKVFATAEDGARAKLSLIGVDYPVLFDSSFQETHTTLRLVINVRASCESQRLAEMMDHAFADAVDQFHLEQQVFFTECFGMMDEGRE